MNTAYINAIKIVQLVVEVVIMWATFNHYLTKILKSVRV